MKRLIVILPAADEVPAPLPPQPLSEDKKGSASAASSVIVFISSGGGAWLCRKHRWMR